MAVLITGCAGFIGSHATELLLSQGLEVIGIDNFDPFYPRHYKEDNLKDLTAKNNFKFFEGDIVNKSFLQSLPNNITSVIHLAAKAGVRPSIDKPGDYIQTNVVGTSNILEWMKAREIKKMVFASSSSVYGNNKKIPFAETDNVDNPISPYAFTKKACELLNHNYHHLYGMDIINLRFFTVYGPRQRPDLAIRKFIDLIKNNQPVTLFGDGSTMRDYSFIDDIVSGISSAHTFLKKNNGVYEIINLGNNNPVKLTDLVLCIYKLLGKTPDIVYDVMQPGDVERTFADVKKAEKMLQYKPSTSIETGIGKFIEWYDTVNKQ